MSPPCIDIRCIEDPLFFHSKTMSTINYWPRLRLNTFLDYDSVSDITKTSVQIKLTACCGTGLGTG